LMAISGTYGAAGTEYRTERDSFSKIIGYSGTTGDTGYFKVWTKAGQILEYGNTADSRIEAQGKTQARVWALNKISDTQGNTLTFTYVEDSPNGDYYPQRIDYTSNPSTGLVANNAVQFQYETRPDITPMYFQGSLIKSTQRLTKVQTFNGVTQSKEYRLAYQIGSSSNRSRATSLTECDGANTPLCFLPITLGWQDGTNGFSSPTQWGTDTVSGWGTYTERFVDVNGDGLPDYVRTLPDINRVQVLLNNGHGFNAPMAWSADTGSGWSTYTEDFVDVNGDGLPDYVRTLPDINRVQVLLNNGHGFNAPVAWTADTASGWSTYTKDFVDVNGDGLPDYVRTLPDINRVQVLLNNGHGFNAPVAWTTDTGSGWSTYTQDFVDVNGDGLPDYVRTLLDINRVQIFLNNGQGFNAPMAWTTDTGSGWSTYTKDFVDVNGDGLPDYVRTLLDINRVQVFLNNGRGFNAAVAWTTDTGSGWSTYTKDFLDVNGDGLPDYVRTLPDINRVQVLVNNGHGFNAPVAWTTDTASGWSTYTKDFVDLNGDGLPDYVRTLPDINRVQTFVKSGPKPDLIINRTDGLLATATLIHKPLTNSGIYTKGTGAVFPLQDIQAPLYVVSQVQGSNGIGGVLTTNYTYGALKADLSGRGLLGFGWMQSTSADTGLSVRTDYRQDWPYTGLPSQVKKTQPTAAGPSNQLSLVTNTYGCLTPQTGTTCTVATGNRYFPYLSQSVESGWDLNGTVLLTVTTGNTFDGYGNATQVSVSTGDGTSKTTTNTYNNDLTHWYLGRLLQSQVQSVTP
ncbi:MAG: hypothetical protein EKK46_13730, partial [Rhodocyclaceae bacterium]